MTCFRTDPTLADKTTDIASDRDMTALQYACRSELGKINQAYADRLFLCAELLLDRRSAARAEFDRGGSPHGSGSPLDMCAWRGGNVKIAQLLIEHGWQPTIGTVLAALGHFQRHGKGNYDVAALCLESGVDINEMRKVARCCTRSRTRATSLEPGGWWIMAPGST